MKAITRTTYGPPDVLELSDVDIPAATQDRVLIRVRAASVNPLDWHEVTGVPYIVRPGHGLRRPTKQPLVGTDVAGEVESVGPAVAGLKPGDRVFGMGTGTFAQYATARERSLALIPEGIGFEAAAAMPMAALTALQALRKAGIEPGHKVLINGASGGVGTFAVQIAKHYGAEVTAVCSARNVEAVRTLGADHVVDYRQQDFTRTAERYNVILDVAGTRSIADRRRVLDPGGTLMVVGGPMTNRWVGPLFPLLRVLAVSRFTKGRMTGMLAKSSKEDFELLAEMLGSGHIVPVVERTYPLAEVPDALRHLGEGHARGKIVITV